jgi:cytosine/creatinine deaminase
MHRRRNSPFYAQLEHEISILGGMHNAHLHLDRANILDPSYMRVGDQSILETSHISLHEKHHLINDLHASAAYQTEDFNRRVNQCLDVMVDVDTRRADTLVDVTADCVGMSALQMMQAIQSQRKGQIDLQIGAYSPLGFRDDEPDRWAVFERGAQSADFVAALPEADDRDDYPENIGFEEHLRRMLTIAKSKNCELHVHTDQRNEPTESGTERLIDAVKKYGGPTSDTAEPKVWSVHMISPSTYDEPRFERMVRGMLECNIGLICCPSAAIGMRQLRPQLTPTYNSIPRVLDLLAAGVHVRLASDNIADICSPSTTADLVDEVFILSAAIRYYDVKILAKLAAGRALDDEDRAIIRSHLESNDLEISKVLAGRARNA